MKIVDKKIKTQSILLLIIYYLCIELFCNNRNFVRQMY